MSESQGEQINAAGFFLRALKEEDEPAPGAQSSKRTPLPVRDILVALEAASQSMDQLQHLFDGGWNVLQETVGNLRSLGLVELDVDGEQELVSITDLGRDVARRSG